MGHDANEPALTEELNLPLSGFLDRRSGVYFPGRAGNQQLLKLHWGPERVSVMYVSDVMLRTLVSVYPSAEHTDTLSGDIDALGREFERARDEAIEECHHNDGVTLEDDGGFYPGALGFSYLTPCFDSAHESRPSAILSVRVLRVGEWYVLIRGYVPLNAAEDSAEHFFALPRAIQWNNLGSRPRAAYDGETPYTMPRSRFDCVAQLGELRRISATFFDSESNDMSCAYNTDDTTLSVFVYPPRVPPTDPTRMIIAESLLTQQSIGIAYPNASTLDNRAISVTHHGEQHNGQLLIMRADDPFRTDREVITGAYVYHYGGWVVSYRFTYPAPDGAGQELIEDAIAAIVWPRPDTIGSPGKLGHRVPFGPPAPASESPQQPTRDRFDGTI